MKSNEEVQGKKGTGEDTGTDPSLESGSSDAEKTIIEATNTVELDKETEIETTNTMSVIEVREKLKQLGLKTAGKIVELRDRLKEYIRKKDDSADEEDSEEDEDSESGNPDSEESENEGHNAKSRVLRRKCEKEKVKKSVIKKPSSFTIKDIEESVSHFTGDDSSSIGRWIQEFEDMGKLLEWNDLQKLIYAKRLLWGSAIQFVITERGIVTWKNLRKRLKNEFKTRVNSAQIHSRLHNRKRLPRETGRQYIYAMREIASEVDIEEDALIEHIIDGIPEKEYNKAFLYQANTLQELKINLEIYDRMKEKAERKMGYGRKEETKGKKEAPVKNKKPRCNTCGSLEHDAQNCPDKGKGPKCFKCNNFGHLANKCTSKEKHSAEKDVVASVNCIYNAKTMYAVKVNVRECSALIDSGSVLSLIKEEKHQEIGAPPLAATPVSITGAGNATTKAVGTFDANIVVNGETYHLRLFVVPTYSIPHDVILGRDFLKEVDMQMRQGVIIQLRKIKDGNQRTAGVALPEIEDKVKVDVEGTAVSEGKICTDLREILFVEKNELEVKDQYRDRIEKLVKEYQPATKVETKVETKIILKDEIPVKARPRRLAPMEKAILTKQVDEWLKDGVIQVSDSEHTSSVVIVTKRDGKKRVCIDFRDLNKQIKRDHFPMPLIEDKIDELRDARVFSVIDLRNGFLHVPVAEESRRYPAFVTHEGQYDFLKTPFGLCISPTSFLRFIDEVFHDLIQRKIVFTYVNDIIIPGENEEDAFNKLVQVLEVAATKGLEQMPISTNAN
ncbi:uncharacterized protein LOC143378059 [Andrena cerasifolii]|uniref:uncharacterized protein LOC143378059 n=1 Tax=Andrena cerasifolii TaxID=2819439 RepID=UPI004037BDBE